MDLWNTVVNVKEMKVANTIKTFEDLPPDALFIIFSFCGMKHLASLLCVSKDTHKKIERIVEMRENYELQKRRKEMDLEERMRFMEEIESGEVGIFHDYPVPEDYYICSYCRKPYEREKLKLQ